MVLVGGNLTGADFQEVLLELLGEVDLPVSLEVAVGLKKLKLRPGGLVGSGEVFFIVHLRIAEPKGPSAASHPRSPQERRHPRPPNREKQYLKRGF